MSVANIPTFFTNETADFTSTLYFTKCGYSNTRSISVNNSEQYKTVILLVEIISNNKEILFDKK